MGTACEGRRTMGGTAAGLGRVLAPVIPAILRCFREYTLRRRHRVAQRTIRVIESMDLPEDLQRAAINRVMRRVEEALDRYTRSV